MLYLLVKAAVSGVLIALISEVARKVIPHDALTIPTFTWRPAARPASSRACLTAARPRLWNG